MTPDLWALLATGFLSLLVPGIYTVGRGQVHGGIDWAFGNRDRSLDVAPWVGRAVRAHQNLTENIGPFAMLVVVAHLAGKVNAVTALGAGIFFYARVAHVLIYTLGLTHLRTLAFLAGLAGELLIASQLLQ